MNIKKKNKRASSIDNPNILTESSKFLEKNVSINNSNDYSDSINVGPNLDHPYAAPKKVLNATVKGYARKDKQIFSNDHRYIDHSKDWNDDNLEPQIEDSS